MVLDPANGVAKREGGCLLLQHVRSSAVEEHDSEALVHSWENGGEHRPVVECNRHNWCSFGVTETLKHFVYLVGLRIYYIETLKDFVSCWTAYILQDDTRSLQCQSCRCVLNDTEADGVLRLSKCAEKNLILLTLGNFCRGFFFFAYSEFIFDRQLTVELPLYRQYNRSFQTQTLQCNDFIEVYRHFRTYVIVTLRKMARTSQILREIVFE